MFTLATITWSSVPIHDHSANVFFALISLTQCRCPHCPFSFPAVSFSRLAHIQTHHLYTFSAFFVVPHSLLLGRLWFSVSFSSRTIWLWLHGPKSAITTSSLFTDQFHWKTPYLLRKFLPFSNLLHFICTDLCIGIVRMRMIIPMGVRLSDKEGFVELFPFSNPMIIVSGQRKKHLIHGM